MSLLMGNKTALPVYKKGSIGIHDGTFNDVMYVPSLFANLLSVYQISHSGSGKTVHSRFSFHLG